MGFALEWPLREALVQIGPPAQKAIPGLKEFGNKNDAEAFAELISNLDRK